ncbi:arthropsin type [Brachionus plicatilis]|uniref:Arthropsin type n=1 Tax=Brachionus plicatilis TaxID=10195 RepID=A0A3M7RLV1_BRAPC|nr:arthropsin type [Brachionus plicatilis]
MYVNEYWKNFAPIDRKWHFLIAFIYFVIGVFAFFTNFMVCYYLVRIKNVKRPGTYFLINLAIADLGKVLACIPMNAVSSFNTNWSFGQLGCDIYGLASGLFGFVSITTMVFMSLERYLMVKNPLFALKLSNRVVFICIFITWMYSLICIVPQLNLDHGFVLEGLLTSCSFDYLNRDAYSRFFMMVLFVGGFLVPVCLIIFLYSFLFFLLRKNSIFQTYQERGRIKSHEKLPSYYSRSVSYSSKNLHNNCSSSLTKKESDSSNTNLNNSSFIKRQVKVAKTVILIVIMFCIAWLPYAIITLIAQYISPNYLTTFVTPLTTSLPAIFAKTSSIYNPILYTLSNKDCKNYFHQLFILKIFKFKKNNKNSEIKLCEKINGLVGYSQRGISERYFVPNGLAVNQHVYLGEYGNQECCQSESSKRTKARPIEDFCENLKAKVYESDWKAKNLKQLENKIRTCLRNMDPKVVQDHAKTVRSRLDIIRRHGLQYLN